MYDQSRSNSKRTWIAVGGVLLIVGIVGFVALSHRSEPSVMAQVRMQTEFHEFLAYLQKYKKMYHGEELHRRFQNYRDNAAYIRVFNSLGHNWKLGHNEFSDMTFKEFQEIYLPFKMPKHEKTEVESFEAVEIPDSVDWRSKHVVTGVKNQGQCGSCWSFSTTGSVEGAWALAGHGLVSLSEQQLVDCSGSYGNYGCNGGLMDNAFEYIQAHGITSESNYPYTARDGSCNSSLVSDIVARLTDHKDVATNNPEALKTAIAQQPVSVAVEADQSCWQFYSGGTVDRNCGTNLDHGVLAVGYDTTSSTPHYIVKNSWGSSWGMQGYIQIGIASGAGICGIQEAASYPIV